MAGGAHPSGIARLAETIERGLKAALGLGLIAMVALNVFNAAGRYAGAATLTGADEALVYGMIWIVMVGAILAGRAREHLSIDLLPAGLGGAAPAALRLFTDLATLAVCAFVAWHSWSFIGRISAIGQKSMGLGIPMIVPHAAILVGFSGMAAVALVLLLADISALSGRGDAMARPARGGAE